MHVYIMKLQSDDVEESSIFIFYLWVHCAISCDCETCHKVEISFHSLVNNNTWDNPVVILKRGLAQW